MTRFVLESVTCVPLLSSTVGDFPVASLRHKHSLREPWFQRIARVALPSGGVLALVVASWAVAFNGPDPVNASSSVNSSVKYAAPADASDLASTTSRSDVRPPLPDEAEQDVTGTRYATENLDLHAGPDQTSPVLTEIKSGKKVDVTGKIDGKWAEVIHKGTSRWVTAKFIKTKAQMKAQITADKPLGGAPCATGSGVESGLQPDTIRVHRAVCAQFPQILSYGGIGGGGDHASGQAIDIMLGNSTGSGDAIAAFAMKHARELGVSQVIYRQRIWTVQRAGDGWRPMPDRGSPTANHMDHVHVSTYGNSGTS